MFFRRLIIRLRIALTIFFVIAVIAIVGGVFYLNSTGLNQEIRAHISKELEQKGIFVEFDSLQYEFSQGLVAKNALFYSDKDRITKLASIPEVSINLDKTKLLRGIRKINSLSLSGATIELPINANEKNSERLKLSNISGIIEFPEEGSYSTDKLTAQYEGINISIAGILWQEAKKSQGSSSSSSNQKKQAQTYQKFNHYLDYLKYWSWDKSKPPKLTLFVEGDLSSPEKIKAEFNLSAPMVSYRGYEMKKIKIMGDYSQKLLTVDSLDFTNDGNKAQLELDYDVEIRDGRFDVKSNIQVQKFAKKIFKQDLPEELKIHGESEINMKGYFKLPSRLADATYTSVLPAFINPSTALEVKAVGITRLKDIGYRDSKFQSISSEFSWNNGNIYLDKLLLKNRDGYLLGRLLMKNSMITYEAETNFPRRTFQPFIEKGSPVDDWVKKITLEPSSKLFIKSNGKINLKNFTDSEAAVELNLSKINLNGLICDSFNTKIQWRDSTLTGNATLKDTRFKDMAFQQLDSSIHFQEGTFTSQLTLTKPVLRSTLLDSFKATLNIKDKQISLTDIEAQHPSGTLTGSFSTSDEYYHYDLVSTLNPYVLMPFIQYQPTVDFLSRAEINEKSNSHLAARGKINRTNPKEWEAEGNAVFKNLKFGSVPLLLVDSYYKISDQGLLATDSKLIFDYKNYKLHQRFKGSSTGEVTVEKTYIDNIQRTATLENVRGKAYPAPIARLFHRDVAEHLEQYEFHDAPTLNASGVFDIIERKSADQKLDFNCGISCPGFTTNYKFLEGNLALNNFSANVQVVKNKVNVTKMQSRLFDNGIAKGNLYFTTLKDAPAKYSGDLSWQNIGFYELGKTYKFDDEQAGRLRGNIQFYGSSNSIASFNTQKDTMGTFALENSNIFSVPVLGPVSVLINPFIAPLAGKQSLNERLKNISARFKVVNGVIISDDIQSLTPSLTFFGEGSVNLNNDLIDITIRVNYRGLLGKAMELGGEIIKLPFKMLRSVFLNKEPAETGLIQVRGVGNYKKATWKLVPFDPPRDFNVPFFKPGKAQEVPRASAVE